jgi:hypothetical protein
VVAGHLVVPLLVQDLGVYDPPVNPIGNGIVLLLHRQLAVADRFVEPGLRCRGVQDEDAKRSCGAMVGVFGVSRGEPSDGLGNMHCDLGAAVVGLRAECD